MVNQNPATGLEAAKFGRWRKVERALHAHSERAWNARSTFANCFMIMNVIGRRVGWLGRSDAWKVNLRENWSFWKRNEVTAILPRAEWRALLPGLGPEQIRLDGSFGVVGSNELMQVEKLDGGNLLIGRRMGAVPFAFQILR